MVLPSIGYLSVVRRAKKGWKGFFVFPDVTRSMEADSPHTTSIWDVLGVFCISVFLLGVFGIINVGWMLLILLGLCLVGWFLGSIWCYQKFSNWYLTYRVRKESTQRADWALLNRVWINGLFIFKRCPVYHLGNIPRGLPFSDPLRRPDSTWSDRNPFDKFLRICFSPLAGILTVYLSR